MAKVQEEKGAPRILYYELKIYDEKGELMLSHQGKFAVKEKLGSLDAVDVVLSALKDQL